VAEFWNSTRLAREAGFPRPKRIEDFDFGANRTCPPR
jgi:hypothetical protein